MNTKNISPPTFESFEHIKTLIAELPGTAHLLLKHLVIHKPLDSLVVEKSVDVLAKELCKCRRSIQSAIKDLKNAGLITRNSINGRFTPCVTFISSQQVIDCVKNLPNVLQDKKSNRSRRLIQPKPFGFLKDPARFEKIQIEMQQALNSAFAYWNFIRSAFQLIGFNAPLTTEMQSRKLVDGKRGGTHKFRSRNVHLSNVKLEMENVAQYAQCQFVGVILRVNRLAHPLILIDDLNKSSLELLPDTGAILETSPGNFQASIICPRPLSSAEFLLVEDALLGKLGNGDRGAKGIRQLRRFPGSVNNKPGLATAFVTRVERISDRLALTTEELNEFIEAGKKIRGFYEWETEISAGVQNLSAGAISSVDNTPEMLSEGTSRQAVANDKSASGRDFGKAIELIRKGLDDASIIQQIMASAGSRLKYGHSPGHPTQLAYAQRTVSRSRARFKSNAPRMNLAFMKKTPLTVLVNQTTAQPASVKVKSE